LGPRGGKGKKESLNGKHLIWVLGYLNPAHLV
jgi:hypothetical protein